jgi:hypothetical protein
MKCFWLKLLVLTVNIATRGWNDLMSITQWGVLKFIVWLQRTACRLRSFSFKSKSLWRTYHSAQRQIYLYGGYFYYVSKIFHRKFRGFWWEQIYSNLSFYLGLSRYNCKTEYNILLEISNDIDNYQIIRKSISKCVCKKCIPVNIFILIYKIRNEVFSGVV